MSACGPNCGWCGRCEWAMDTPADHPGYPDACDWCDRLVYPDKQLRVNDGRFCSDECATNYEEDYRAHVEASNVKRAG